MPLRASAVARHGAWRGESRDVVVLGYDDRHRRRLAMRGVHGLDILLDLAEPTTLRGGDALALEDGTFVEVVAAPEPLVEIACKHAGTMIRIAWHLGNRHLPVQLVGGKLRIRRDHVIEEMVAALGAHLVAIDAPFDPEGGAYAGHGHDHAHPHAHG